MSPRRKTMEEEHNVLSTTHHKPSAVQEEMEDLNEQTAATHREPSLSLTEEEEEEHVTSQPAVAADCESKDAELDISLRIHEKVASLASKAYRKASAKSNVLCKDRISGVALVKFEDITVGKLLGKGSFSYVHEITKISSGASSHEVKDEDESNGDKLGTEVHANKEQEDHLAFLVANAERRESNTFRYAIKFLKDDIRSNPKAYAIGTADLVVEGMFLASLTHPNIIKVRALPEGGVRSLLQPNAKGYFLVLDRLFDTLSERIYNTWQEQHHVEMASSSGCLCLPFGKNDSKAKEEQKMMLKVRVKVAFDISAALKFMHSKNIIYRDIKPENLGFDIRDDIKLFDLGLVKELHPNDKKRDGTYKLSMAGTPRYMAPECGKYLRYNLSADVYSFSMLLWEIITMTQPLEDFTYTRLKSEVFEDGYRPSLTAVKNKSLRDLIKVGWHQDASKRPSMDTVYEELKKEFQILHGLKLSEKELSHDRRRSTHVPSRISAVNMSTLLRVSSNGDLEAAQNR